MYIRKKLIPEDQADTILGLAIRALKIEAISAKNPHTLSFLPKTILILVIELKNK